MDWEDLTKKFRQLYGNDKNLIFFSVPGRANLLGMHIDHRGGAVNPIAIGEMRIIAQKRNDETIQFFNTDERFTPQKFIISEEIPGKVDWMHWINNIKIENLAVWSKSNEKIFISDSEETRTGEHTINKEKGFEVETISLEDIFLKNNIQRCDLLKIDVEGAEYAILFSAPDIIFEKIESISMEYHPDVNKDKRKDDLVRLFENKGYQTEETILKEGCGLIYAKKKS